MKKLFFIVLALTGIHYTISAQEEILIESLPNEVKAQFILALADSSNLERTMANLSSLARANKEFNALLHDSGIKKWIIEQLSKRGDVKDMLIDTVNAGKVGVGKFLQNLGVTLTQQEIQQAFIEAVKNNNNKAAQTWLDFGAHVNTPDQDSKLTALHMAVKDMKPDLVELLLKHGAEREKTDAAGMKPASYLVKRRLDFNANGNADDARARSKISRLLQDR